MATNLSKKSKSPKSTPCWNRYKSSDRASINSRKKAWKHQGHLLTAKLRAEADRTGSRAKKSAIKQKKRDLYLAQN